MAGICDLSEAIQLRGWAATTMTANLIAERLSSTSREDGQGVCTSEDLCDGALLFMPKRFISECLGQQLLSHLHLSRKVGRVLFIIREAVIREVIGVNDDSLSFIANDETGAMTPLFFQLVVVIVELGTCIVFALQAGRLGGRSWRLAQDQLVDIHAVEQLVPGIELAHFSKREYDWMGRESRCCDRVWM